MDLNKENNGMIHVSSHLKITNLDKNKVLVDKPLINKEGNKDAR